MKKLFVLITFSLFLQGVSAQTWEEHLVTKPGLGLAKAVSSGDLDGDLDNDIAIIGTAGVGWYKGDGNGNFVFTETLSSYNDEGYNIHVADVDNDGDNDILFDATYWGQLVSIPPPIGEPRNSMIFLHENLGGSNFAPRELVMLDTGTKCIEFMPIDMDLDGDIDILFTTEDNQPHSYQVGRVAWVENQGNNNFGTITNLSNFTSEVNSVCAADLSGDTLPEIIFSLKSNDSIWGRQNLGGGTFAIQSLICGDIDDVRDIVAGDMDNDGDADILVTAAYNRLWRIENLGNGNFAEAQLISSQVSDNMFLVDIDYDGWLDILTSTELNNGLVWLKNLSNGLFSNLSYPIPSSVNVKNISAVQLDNDTLIDILTLDELNNYNGRIAWHKNLSNSNIGIRSNITPEVIYSSRIFMIDVDIDDDQDIISVSQGRDEIFWFEYLGSENFDVTANEVSLDQYSGLWDVQPADMNNDDKTDLVAVVYGGLILMQNVGGSFSAPVMLTNTSSFSRHFILEDLDGDEDIDIIYSLEYEDRIAWLENLGNLNFAAEQTLVANVEEAGGLLFKDMDGNGLNDLIFETASPTTAYQNTVSWIPNLGGGNFGNVSVAIDPYIIRYSMADDIDGDGKADLLELTASGGNYYNLRLFQNFGSGSSFLEMGSPPSSFHPNSSAIGDLDGDGDKDIVLGISYTSIGYMMNEGNFNFGSFMPVNGDESITCTPYLVDVNVDGNLDILVAAGASKILWFENPGNLVSAATANLQQAGILVYPNPSKGTFTVDLGGTQSTVHITITNLNGQVIQSQTYTNTRLLNLEIEGAVGMYFVQVQMENGSEMLKLIKE